MDLDSIETLFASENCWQYEKGSDMLYPTVYFRDGQIIIFRVGNSAKDTSNYGGIGGMLLNETESIEDEDMLTFAGWEKDYWKIYNENKDAKGQECRWILEIKEGTQYFPKENEFQYRNGLEEPPIAKRYLIKELTLKRLVITDLELGKNRKLKQYKFKRMDWETTKEYLRPQFKKYADRQRKIEQNKNEADLRSPWVKKIRGEWRLIQSFALQKGRMSIGNNILHIRGIYVGDEFIDVDYYIKKVEIEGDKEVRVSFKGSDAPFGSVTFKFIKNDYISVISTTNMLLKNTEWAK
jgi:hypothetical protein